MRKYLLILAAAAVLTAPKAHAYTATTTTDTVVNNDTNGNHVADPGETFSVTGGGFSAYAPTQPGDPQNLGNDLSLYKYDLNATAQSVTGTSVLYTGTYRIYYTAGNITVSSGTLDLTAAFTGFTGALDGTLTETAGPANPAFADLGPTVGLTGVYNPNLTNGGATGTLNAVLTRGAVPEPGSLALLGTGILPLAGLLRRRRK